MEVVAPAGPMYQAGTLSGNPLAMTAGQPLPRPPPHPFFIQYLHRRLLSTSPDLLVTWITGGGGLGAKAE